MGGKKKGPTDEEKADDRRKAQAKQKKQEAKEHCTVTSRVSTCIVYMYRLVLLRVLAAIPSPWL